MRKALVVGINDYAGASKLKGCENDAREVQELLSFHADERRNFTILEPKNGIDTKAKLLKEIKNLFNGNTETDIALFYFSGHGGYDDKIKDGYIITYDCHPIFMREILDIVNISKCRNCIVIFDSCYSGAMGNITSVASLNEGVTILSASKSDEYSFDGPIHGVFTDLFLAALRGGAADLTGHVTAGGIYAYIDKALGPCGQRPVFKTNTAQFLPLRETDPLIERRTLRNISKYFKDKNDSFHLDPSFEFTNTQGSSHLNHAPYANEKNVKIFKELQSLNRFGLVVPNCYDLPAEEQHMYFAAMKSRSCKLTTLGEFYWQLSKDNKI